MTQKIAYGQCWTCPEWFWYGVLTVPSVPVDRMGRAIDDDGGTQVYRLAPICPKCVGEVNRVRAENDLALFPADSAKVPDGHLGPLDLPGVTVRTDWFVPTNGLPIPAHTVECFDPECPGCLMDALHEALDEAFQTAPDTDNEDTPYENHTLCPVAGLPPAVQAIPVRNAPESAGEPCPTCGAEFGTPHKVRCGCPAGFSDRCSYWVSSGPCKCAVLAGVVFSDEPPRCLCGRSNPHVVTEACE